MAKEKKAAPKKDAEPAAEAGATQTPASVSLLGTYVKDISFENIAVQNNFIIKQSPKFELNLNNGNRKMADDIYEVSLNVKVKATEGDQTVFILDLDHAGRFRMNGVEQNALVPFLYIECPRVLFPYTRRIVSETTLDGGLLPLNLENIDFVAMFQNSVKQAQEGQPAGQN